MPVLQIMLSRELPSARQHELVRELVDLSTNMLGKRKAVTAVMVQVLPAQHWYVGGSLLSEEGYSSACLEITVTQGTNTAQEKADFVAQAHQVLRTYLSSDAAILTPASYVSVHEVPADSWGYGGLTQAQRRVAGAQGATV
ncbi:tautomerase family protein [Curvibacter sp. CHRR-16]|uniref:tautomerase family protein n=1 Tax=Curvibacter sp. CHRR-16 TaxID=2835872 RepID=UPI001BDB24F3|nr:tautomerase family protein [Curvibacter sp. CHRR-16]MBT0571011.1 tautomerase family protein [Curvibacter sp. CHRR-16]